MQRRHSPCGRSSKEDRLTRCMEKIKNSKEATINKRQPILARLLRFTTFEPNTGCWLWTGVIGKNGYGRMRIGPAKLRFAHRISYQEHVGQIPTGLYVLHKCDNPMCVNPDHLFLGTISENNKDSAKKGRTLKGEDHQNHKLTEDIIRAIRESSNSTRSLSKKYGVARRTIDKVRHRVTWRHIY